MRHLLLFAICCLFACMPCSAQDVRTGQGFGIEASTFAGKVVKHTSKFHLPVPEITTGCDINFLWKTYGKCEWEQRRRYPTVGIAFTYTNYGIDSIYGRCFSIYPNIVIPLITGKRLEWTLRIGDGAGYVTQRYSRIGPKDTFNNAISSHINDFASFMTDVRYRVNDHWDVQLGGNFSHISNASYQQPNLGINSFGAHIGIRYFPVTSSPSRIVRKLPHLSNRWLVSGRVTLAHDGANAPLGPAYPVYLATAYVSRRWISKNKFFGGIDYSYHSDIYAYQRNNGFGVPGKEWASSYKSAVLVGNEFLLGRLGVVLQVGYYVKQAFLEAGKYYEKIGGNFYLVQKEHGPVTEVFVCAFLKTHLTIAELAEFGVGMSF